MAREKDTSKEGKDGGKLRKRELAEAAARRAALEPFAEQFKALGDPTRLAVVLYLRARASESSAGRLSLSEPGNDAEDEDGSDDADEAGDFSPGAATVGEVGCHVFGTEKGASTLSHHLKELRRVGLVQMKRRGKNMLCRVDRDSLAVLAAYLQGGPAAERLELMPNEGGDG